MVWASLRVAEVGRKARVIDAHHHLWRYAAAEYGWIDASMGQLRRDFLPTQLHLAMASAGVEGAVAVQARQTVEETRWLLDLARDDAKILGVVGWLPIAPRDVLRCWSSCKVRRS
jgi:L-fuconolactonase